MTDPLCPVVYGGAWQEALTPQKCIPHVTIRGLVRVRCVQELDRVLHFMTRKGLINTGVLLVKQPTLPEQYHQVSGANTMGHPRGISENRGVLLITQG